MTLFLAGLIAAGTLTACKDETPQVANQAAPQSGQMPEGHPPTNKANQPQAAGHTGTVSETMSTAGYTYVQIDTGDEKLWAAAPETQVAVGDVVAVPAGQPMYNYHSQTLDRNFDVVYFVSGIMKGGESAPGMGMGGMESGNPQMPEGHPDIKASAKDVNVDLSGIAKAEGGQTVGEVFENQDSLSGKEVAVRGKVVKFSPQIMGKNWIHVQDGTGSDGTNDLTVTTDETADVGDTVVVSGILETDKDFGYGYQYDVILEDARVVVE